MATADDGASRADGGTAPRSSERGRRDTALLVRGERFWNL